MKNDDFSEVKSKTEWNTLRKRLISAKIREIVDEKIRLVLKKKKKNKTTTFILRFTASATAPTPSSVRLAMEASAAFTTSTTIAGGALL